MYWEEEDRKAFHDTEPFLTTKAQEFDYIDYDTQRRKGSQTSWLKRSIFLHLGLILLYTMISVVVVRRLAYSVTSPMHGMCCGQKESTGTNVGSIDSIDRWNFDQLPAKDV